MKKNLTEVLKTIAFIPAGLAIFTLILGLAGGIDWVIFQVIESINPNQGGLLDEARSWGIILLTLAAFAVACFGLLTGSSMYFYVSMNVSPKYIHKKILIIVLELIFLALGYFIFSTLFKSIPEESSIFTWGAYGIGILCMLVPGIAGVVSSFGDGK